MHPIMNPTTAGDFCRRFKQSDIDSLMQAIIDVDGVIVATTATCIAGGFRRIRMRGDCKFSQTEYLAGWDALGIRFQFGYEARTNLKEIADNLDPSAWKKLTRALPNNKTVETRTKPTNVKRQIIRERNYVHLELLHEEVVEFDYQLNACDKTYRMVVVRKNISKEQGDVRLIDDIRYLFSICRDSPRVFPSFGRKPGDSPRVFCVFCSEYPGTVPRYVCVFCYGFAC